MEAFNTYFLLFLVAPALLLLYMHLKGYRSPNSLRTMAEAIGDGGRMVDVRTPEEFRDGHHSFAVNIPVTDLGARADELGPRSTPVVVYCRSGSRSARAKQILSKRGYSQLYDLGPYRNLEKLPRIERKSEQLSKNQRKRSKKRRRR